MNFFTQPEESGSRKPPAPPHTNEPRYAPAHGARDKHRAQPEGGDENAPHAPEPAPPSATGTPNDDCSSSASVQNQRSAASASVHFSGSREKYTPIHNFVKSAILSSFSNRFKENTIFFLQGGDDRVRMQLWRKFILQQLLIRPQKLRTM